MAGSQMLSYKESTKNTNAPQDTMRCFMQTLDIKEAKTHLSRLVDEAAKGKIFVIAKAGKPMVKVLPLSDGELEGTKRLGFMSGEIAVPDDFDTLAVTEISRLFEGKSL
jgi:prevent-host-death family protein